MMFQSKDNNYKVQWEQLEQLTCMNEKVGRQKTSSIEEMEQPTNRSICDSFLVETGKETC